MASPSTPPSPSPRVTDWVSLRRQSEHSMEGELQQLRAVLETESKTYTYSQAIYHIEENPRSCKYVTARDRDEQVSWFRNITHDLSFSISVFYQSTLLLDTFLSKKTKREFLQTMAASCYSIATKLVESCDSVVALSHKLVSKYYSGCSVTDVEKMEAFLIQTPDLASARSLHTIQDYIKKFHRLAERSEMFSLPQSLTLSSHLCHLYKCAQHVVCNHELMKYRPSMLGLAILGCHLKQLNCDWLSTLLYLEEILQIRGGELSICYEAVAAYFPTYFASTPLPRLPSSQLTPSKPPRLQKWCDSSGSHGDNGDEDEDDGTHKEGVIKEKKVIRRKNRRRYRPPTSRTINVAIV